MNKQELKYIAYSVGFSVVWFTLVLPRLISDGVENKSPLVQFLFLNIFLIVFLQIFLKTITLNNKRATISATVGLVSLFLGLDTLMPPYLISMKGELLSGVLLSKSSTDYIWGLLAQQLNLSGLSVYIFTYVVMPFILLYISAKLLPNFVKNL